MMFREWGFLLSEIWVLLALAALVGLLAGWIIWGRRSEGDTAGSDAELTRLRGALSDCEAKGRTQTTRIATLEGALAEEKAPKAAVPVAAPVMAEVKAPPAPKATPVVKAAPIKAAAPKAAAKPAALPAARDGKPDDLKLISGIGPKLEKLCNSLGFWHFDQIAAWKANEIAWVDENLEGFKGRVTRDEWVKQAKVLAKKKG